MEEESAEHAQHEQDGGEQGPAHAHGHNAEEEGLTDDQGAGYVYKKRKARRAPRQKKSRNWKPYSEMNWEERRQVQEKEAQRAEGGLGRPGAVSAQPLDAVTASLNVEHGTPSTSAGARRRQRRRSKLTRGVAPPAPRITNDSVMRDREERTLARQFEDAFDENGGGGVGGGGGGGGGGFGYDIGSGAEPEPADMHTRDELDFDTMLNDFMHSDLENLSRNELIDRIIASGKEVETLNSQIIGLKRKVQRLQAALDRQGGDPLAAAAQSPDKQPSIPSAIAVGLHEAAT